jgi:hypothetical protein
VVRPRRPWPRVAALAAAFACGALAQEAGFATGTARRDCAPWDGAATRVTLRSAAHADAGLRLEVVVYDAPERVSGRAFRFSSLTDRVGAATLCGRGPCQFASGTVRFEPFVPGGAVRGRLDLLFPGRAARGAFRAAWDPAVALCG